MRLARSDVGYRVIVRDQGPGVPKEAEARLFQRFFTTDNDHGTGLGLAIVKSVIEAHGGSVVLERERCEGACVVVELRAHEGAP